MTRLHSLQDGLELLLLLCRQASGELDLDAYNEVATLSGLLALWHAEIGVSFCPCWPCGTAAANAKLFAVDSLYCAAPASESFFEVEFDGALDVVAFAGEEGVWFL